jgi:5,10-methylenetetrahydromethanopterin reductase
LTHFSLELLPTVSVKENLAYAKLAEELGLEYVWVADDAPAPPNGDVFVTLSAIAMKTSKIRLGTSICNPYTRHPAVLASSVLALMELSRGRFALGLGPGGRSTLAYIGVDQIEHPAAMMRETISTMRRLLSGETVTDSFASFRLKNVHFRSPGVKVPIYLAARSPIITRLVGEMADGALLTSPVGHLPSAVGIIRDGAKRAMRGMNEIDVGNAVHLSIGRNRSDAREVAKSSAAIRISVITDEMVQAAGISLEERDKVRARFRAAGPTSAAEYVTDAMLDQVTIAGSPEDCIKLVKKQVSLGVDHLMFSPPFGPDPVEAIKLLVTDVIKPIQANS